MNLNNKELRLTKWEAVESQLKEVIKLFFEKKDPITIHTVAFATHNILYDLSKKNGKPSILKNENFIVPGKFKEYCEFINRAGNFFKHANRDPNGEILFAPVINEYLIYDCCIMHDQLSRPRLKECTVFKLWFVGKYPQWISGELNKVLTSGINKPINYSDYSLFLDLLQHLDLIPDIPVVILDPGLVLN